MKKRAILIGSVSVIVLAACILLVGMKPTIKPEKDTYPAGTTSVTAVVKYVLPGQYSMGHRYVLEQFSEGTWQKVEKDPQGAFFDDGGFSPSHGTKVSFDITKYADSLQKGQYRVTVEMNNKKGIAKSVAFEFSVT